MPSHEEGGLMLAQLAHVGAMETTGDAIVSASWTRSELTQQMSREASVEELDEILALYRAAALRCHEGGLDGIEVTMAHGMLLASFLSPAMNYREDEYGGGLEGRTLFPRQVLAAVREAMGEEAIVGIRIPGDEMVEDGISPVDAATIAKRLVATGSVDYVSVTAGNNTRKMARVDQWPPTPAPLGAFRHLSRAVKEVVDVPVATVGRVTTLELAEEILRAATPTSSAWCGPTLPTLGCSPNLGRTLPAQSAPASAPTCASTRFSITSHVLVWSTRNLAVHSARSTSRSARRARRWWSAPARPGSRRGASRCGASPRR